MTTYLIFIRAIKCYLLGFEFALECSFAGVVLAAGPFAGGGGGAVAAVDGGVAPIGLGVLQMRMRLSGSHIQCHQLQVGKMSFILLTLSNSGC